MTEPTTPLPLGVILIEFYKFLEREGLIDEQVRNMDQFGPHYADKFIVSWPRDKTLLTADPIKEEPKELPDPNDLLQRAHVHMDAAQSISERDEFQGHRPQILGKTEMQHMVITENLSLLAIAGYLKQIVEKD